MSDYYVIILLLQNPWLMNQSVEAIISQSCGLKNKIMKLYHIFYDFLFYLQRRR